MMTPLLLLIAVAAHAAGDPSKMTYAGWKAANPSTPCYDDFHGSDSAKSAAVQLALLAKLKARGYAINDNPDTLFTYSDHELCFLKLIMDNPETDLPGGRFVATLKEIKDVSPFFTLSKDKYVEYTTAEGDTYKLPKVRRPETLRVGSARVVVMSRPMAVKPTGRTCKQANEAAAATGAVPQCEAACRDGCEGEDFNRCQNTVCQGKADFVE